MENWKVAVILVLLFGLGGYGFYQANSSGKNTENPDGTQTPAPTGQPPKMQMVEKQLIEWNIPAENWVNTPKPITVQDLKGHVTLIEFWRSGCSHCEEAAPFMTQLYQKYTPLGLKMVTFQSPGRPNDPENPEANWETVKNTIKDWRIPYPVAFDKGRELFNTYHGDLYPMVMVVDPMGIVRFQQTGHDAKKMAELERFIKFALGKTNDMKKSSTPRSATKP